MSLRSNTRARKLPAVDERLVAPESRHEIQDGRVRYVAPADEPHGTTHSKLNALLEAHAAGDYQVACDMLTRTSKIDDVAPDASIYPRERDPETGGRRIEELAFEVASTETLSEAAKKARKLTTRGVRRVFAIDVKRQATLEWSASRDTWSILDRKAVIEDRALGAPLPIAALTEAAKADDAMAHALLRKQNPVLQVALAEKKREGKAEGLADAVLDILDVRRIKISAKLRDRIRAQRNTETLRHWLQVALKCKAVSELFEA